MDKLIELILLSSISVLVISLVHMQPYFHFKKLCSGLHGRVKHTQVPNELKYEGIFKDRSYTVLYRYRRVKPLKFTGSYLLKDSLEIRIPILQKFWLRLLPEKVESDNATEIQIGHPELDDRYLIHTDQPEAAREYLSITMVRDCIRLLPIHPDRIEFYRGKVTLMISDLFMRKPHPIEIQGTLIQLIKMVLFYEEQKTEIFRIAESTISSLCPFCRGEMDNLPDLIVRCSVCSTRLHESCWIENGQCTTWGCHSSASQRI